MIGVLVNTGTVLFGSLVGMLFNKGIPERISNALIKGLGLCTLLIGIQGALKGQNALVMILSVAIGVVIGEIIDIDGKLEKLSKWVENKVKGKGAKGDVAQGFMTASMLFCIGSMTIVGSLQSGLTGDNTMIFTKSTLDLVSSFALSASLGVGVMLSSVFVFVFQGLLVLLSGLVAPLFTEVVIAEVTCAGSIIIIGLGLNLIGVTKLKCANYLPAIIMPLVLCLFFK